MRRGGYIAICGYFMIKIWLGVVSVDEDVFYGSAVYTDVCILSLWGGGGWCLLCVCFNVAVLPPPFVCAV